jgi:hypothetical protein
MDKKVFQMYESPALQVVELKVKSAILVGSTESNAEGIGSETPVDGGDEE